MMETYPRQFILSNFQEPRWLFANTIYKKGFYTTLNQLIDLSLSSRKTFSYPSQQKCQFLKTIHSIQKVSFSFECFSFNFAIQRQLFARKWCPLSIKIKLETRGTNSHSSYKYQLRNPKVLKMTKSRLQKLAT